MTDVPQSPLTTDARYRLMFDEAPVGLLIYGADRRIIDCNEACAAVFRSKRQRIIGFDLTKLPDRRIIPTIEEALAGRESFYQGGYHTATSDVDIVAVFRARPIRDAAGAICGAIATIEDATERVRVEEELRRQLDVVREQTETIHALGTPILRVWEGVLCLPVIGAVSRERVTEMTESMLAAIIEERARFAIIDLTGVDLVDTATAQHLMHLFRTAQLVGAEGVLCGIRPAVAQTIVELGGEIQGIRTLRTMQEALQHCLQRLAQG